MPDLRFRGGPDFKAGSPGSAAIIGLFPKQEEARFKEADRLGDGAVHEERGAADVVDLLHLFKRDPVVDLARGARFEFGY